VAVKLLCSHPTPPDPAAGQLPADGPLFHPNPDNNLIGPDSVRAPHSRGNNSISYTSFLKTRIFASYVSI
jgi:hypothetical protein